MTFISTQKHCNIYENRFHRPEIQYFVIYDKSRVSSEEAGQLHYLTTTTSFSSLTKRACRGERKRSIAFSTQLLSSYSIWNFSHKLFSFSWNCISVLRAGNHYQQICGKLLKKKAFAPFQCREEASLWIRYLTSFRI